MKKLFYLTVTLYFNLAFSSPIQETKIFSLRFLATKNVLNFIKGPQIRKTLKEMLQDNQSEYIHAFEFNEQVIGQINLSEFNLSNGNLSKCTFNKTDLSHADLKNVKLIETTFNQVNLRGADLRDSFSDPKNFEGCVFDNVDLEGTLLYGNTEEEYLFLKGMSTPYNLVRQYSELRKHIRVMHDEGLIKKEQILLEQANIFKKFLKCIDLNLENQSLNEFDLTGLDLQKAYLSKACLSRARLSEKVVLPYYPPQDHTPLFNFWINGDEEQDKLLTPLLERGIFCLIRINFSTVNSSREKIKNKLIRYYLLI